MPPEPRNEFVVRDQPDIRKLRNHLGRADAVISKTPKNGKLRRLVLISGRALDDVQLCIDDAKHRISQLKIYLASAGWGTRQDGDHNAD